MARRKELSEQEIRIIKKKVNDEEAFEKFFNDCYLRNLRPATVTYYKNEFHASIKIIDKQLVDFETDKRQLKHWKIVKLKINSCNEEAEVLCIL